MRLDPWAKVPQASPDTTIELLIPTVDGRNPANQLIWRIYHYSQGFYLSQLVQDFWTNNRITPIEALARRFRPARTAISASSTPTAAGARERSAFEIPTRNQVGRNRKSQNFEIFCKLFTNSLHNSRIVCKLLQVHIFQVFTWMDFSSVAEEVPISLAVARSVCLVCLCPCFVAVAVVAGVVLTIALVVAISSLLSWGVFEGLSVITRMSGQATSLKDFCKT